MGAAVSGRPRNNGARSGAPDLPEAGSPAYSPHPAGEEVTQAPGSPWEPRFSPSPAPAPGMTQEEAPQQQGTEQPLRPSQWRMDFRKSLLGTRTRSVGQTSTLFQEGSKNGPAEDWRMHSKPLQETSLSPHSALCFRGRN